VSDGLLRLLTTNDTLAGYSFTSGALTTENSFQFTYGRIDISARLPQTMGLWPAFWLLPVGTPMYGPGEYELDFLEAWGGNTHQVNAYFHWAHSQVQCQASGPDFSASFHVFTLIWSPGRLEWQVDGAQRCVHTEHVPNIPMYLLLDTAIDGPPQRVDGSTRLPQITAIDYVRVWATA
jgi:beta-glucanase (GH16 family)